MIWVLLFCTTAYESPAVCTQTRYETQQQCVAIGTKLKSMVYSGRYGHYSTASVSCVRIK